MIKTKKQLLLMLGFEVRVNNELVTIVDRFNLIEDITFYCDDEFTLFERAFEALSSEL